ncbi:hypothetical protein VIGAN_01095000 [Vigna angularis var. angularis]|uniref:Glycosyl transferase 64 domain-containing protein n=1 Tax=Vigna angularis var. angularis TaxID=157739 RepID=A0A0S3QYW8_PHAAN|nr:hypothetical protein VIGAN_01095000 [Vigna angularis var. angularis]
MASPLATAILLAALFGVVSITKSAVPHECAAARNQNHQALRRDRVTVLMNGFSESRIPLLHSLAVAYSLSPIVSSVLVLWGNPSTASSVLHQLARNLSLSTSSSPISLLLQPSASLNNRFLPRPDHISTDAVLICDDDVEVDSKSLEFAFRVWEKNPNRLVGLFARSHDIDLNRREWVYTVHPDRFSIVLTKFMLLRARYLFLYTCVGGAGMARARGIVDAVRNCEDVLMNLVVAEEAQVGPLLVGAKRVRDYGDARNDGEEEVRVGLSSRKGEHRKRRGWCIGEFHRVLGRMPLRYSYGKVVDDVGEQGLCYKDFIWLDSKLVKEGFFFFKVGGDIDSRVGGHGMRVNSKDMEGMLEFDSNGEQTLFKICEYFHATVRRCAIVVGFAALITGLEHLGDRYDVENVHGLSWALAIWP